MLDMLNWHSADLKDEIKVLEEEIRHEALHEFPRRIYGLAVKTAFGPRHLLGKYHQAFEAQLYWQF